MARSRYRSTGTYKVGGLRYTPWAWAASTPEQRDWMAGLGYVGDLWADSARGPFHAHIARDGKEIRASAGTPTGSFMLAAARWENQHTPPEPDDLEEQLRQSLQAVREREAAR